MTLICMRMKLHAELIFIFFHMKGFALRLVLKQRHKRTRKWPIKFSHKFLVWHFCPDDKWHVIWHLIPISTRFPKKIQERSAVCPWESAFAAGSLCLVNTDSVNKNVQIKHTLKRIAYNQLCISRNFIKYSLVSLTLIRNSNSDFLWNESKEKTRREITDCLYD